MTKARSRLLAVVVLVAFALAIGQVPAHAQTARLTAKIPFGFYVGGKEFPSGEYTVERGQLDMHLVHLADREGHRLIAIATPAIRQPEHGAKLIFNKYGDEYFLSEVRWRESSTALQFPPSSRERELAKKTAPQQILTTDKRS